MFERRQTTPQRNTFAAVAALFVTTAFLAAPALAATTAQLPCKESPPASLLVEVTELTTEFVNHSAPEPALKADTAIQEIKVTSSDSLLAPRAEAAIRDAFKQSDAMSNSSKIAKPVLSQPMAGTEPGNESQVDGDEEAETDTGMNTKLPGISDDDLVRYKKQMYRRDI